MTDRLEITYRPLDSLIPYARNPRKNDPHVARMKGILKEFGFRYPIVAKQDGEIVAGHLRVMAARELGMTEVPAVGVEGLTAAQIKAFRLADNQTARWVEWDEDLLRLELEELKEMDFDMELTGFDADELGGLLMGLSEGEPGPEHQSLADRFGVPPFSVLDARQGYWQERKRAWLALGIQSELGRGGGVDSRGLAGSDDGRAELLPRERERERERENTRRDLLGFSKQARSHYAGQSPKTKRNACN